MAELIRDLERFQKDCRRYQTIIERIEPVDAARHRNLNTMYHDFLLKVEAVDKSVEDMVNGFVAVGLQHGTYVEELKKARLKLDNAAKDAEKLLLKHEQQ